MNIRVRISSWTKFTLYFGGAFHVWSTPNGTVWDVLIWPWYVGRYIATHFTVLGGV